MIYTGQRRLARNLLRDVVGRYIGNEPDALFALSEIQKVAALIGNHVWIACKSTMALAFAPLEDSIITKFLRPMVKGRIACSA